MEKSTPINRLPKNQNQNSGNNANALVQDILNEINSEGDQNSYNKSAMNEQSLKYALDESQMVIPEAQQHHQPQQLPHHQQVQQHMPQAHMQQNMPQQQQQQQQQAQQQYVQQPTQNTMENVQENTMDMNMDMDTNDTDIKSNSLIDTLKQLVKRPFIVFFIVLLITLKPVNDILLKYMPKIGSIETSNNAYIANFAKALFAGSLFLVADKVIQ